MSLKHLQEGSDFPPLSSKLRLYSMKYCPYAQRTRLVLVAKSIPFEYVNINLTKKPKWFLDLNPSGTVPVLQLDENKVIPESLITAEYLDHAYPGNKLIPSDPYTNAKQKLVIEAFSSKVTPNFYKVLRGTDADGDKAFLDGLEEVVEKKLNGNYFGGDNAAFVDFMIWPWLERLEYFEKFKGLKIDQARFNKLNGYIKRMKELSAVKETINKPEAYNKFFEGYFSGNADYDFEL